MLNIFSKIVHKHTLFILLGILFIVFVGFEYSRSGDFRIYYDASFLFGGKINFYHQLYGNDKVFEYYGSPVLTLLLHPFTYLPLSLASILWKTVNLFMLWRIWNVIIKYFELSSVEKHSKWTWFSFLALIFPIYANFHNVQFAVLILYTVVEGVYQIMTKKKYFLGALIISLGIFIKVAPIIIIPYLIYRNQLKGVACVLLTFILLFFLPTVFVGIEHSITLWESWLAKLNPSSDVNVFDMNNRGNYGVSALISSLFIENIRHVESTVFIRRHIVNLELETVKQIIFITRMVLVFLTLLVLRTLPFKNIQSKIKQFWELSYLLLVIPLLFPQQRAYNFVYLLPAISYLIYCLFYDEGLFVFKGWKSYLFVLAIILLNIELLLGMYREYYWHFKIMSYGTLLILYLLITTLPNSSSKSK